MLGPALINPTSILAASGGVLPRSYAPEAHLERHRRQRSVAVKLAGLGAHRIGTVVDRSVRGAERGACQLGMAAQLAGPVAGAADAPGEPCPRRMGGALRPIRILRTKRASKAPSPAS